MSAEIFTQHTEHLSRKFKSRGLFQEKKSYDSSYDYRTIIVRFSYDCRTRLSQKNRTILLRYIVDFSRKVDRRHVT